MELRGAIAQQPLLGPFSMRNYFLAAKLEGRGLAGNKAMIRRLITMGFIAVARINHLAQLSHCELANLLLHYSLTLKGSRSAWCLRKKSFLFSLRLFPPGYFYRNFIWNTISVFFCHHFSIRKQISSRQSPRSMNIDFSSFAGAGDTHSVAKKKSAFVPFLDRAAKFAGSSVVWMSTVVAFWKQTSWKWCQIWQLKCRFALWESFNGCSGLDWAQIVMSSEN